MKSISGKLYKRVSLLAISFVLAVSSLSAVAPFYLGQVAHAIPAIDQVFIDANTNGIYDLGDSPFFTIQTAVDAASPGNTIFVNPGTYTGNVNINKSITLLGADKHSTIINGDSSGPVVTISATSNVILKGFTISNSGTNINTDAGVGLVGVSGVIVEGNIISDNVTGIAVMSSSGNTIRNNEIKNSTRYGIVLEEYPLTGAFSTLNTISGNTITANARDGIYVGKDCNSNIITNNTINGATGTTEGSFEANGIYLWKSASNVVTNNTIANNVAFGIEMFGSKNNTITGNDVTGNLDGLHIRNIDEIAYPGYSIRDNNISNNKIYDNTHVNLYGSPNFDFNIENNWWGSADETTIVNKLASWDSSGNVVPGTTVFLDYTPWCMNSECTIFSSANAITQDATNVNLYDATLNGTNGSYGATGRSFWVSLSPIVTTSPNIPSGVYSTPDMGAIAANTEFTASLSSLTTSGVPSSMPAITPNTTYYYVAWSLVDGTWYPGQVKSFTTAPLVAPMLTSPGNNAVVKGNPSLTNSWTSVPSATKYIYESYNDAGAGAASLRWHQEFTTTSKTASNVTDTTFWWRVKAVDAAGNESDWSPLWKVTVDNTAPSVSIDAPTGTLYNTNTAIRGTATDSNLRHYWVNVKRNGSTVYDQVVLSAGITNVLLYTATLDGNYIVTLAARDSAGGGSDTGNRSADVVKSFTVDKTVPAEPTAIFTATPSATTVADGGYTTENTFTFNLSSDGDTIRYQLKYWNDIIGSPFKESTPWNPSNLSGYSSSLGVYNDQFTQGEGTHYFAFSACDAAGNCSAYGDPFVVTYDVTAPDAPTLLTPENNDVINYNSFWFNWTDVTDAVSYEAQFSQSDSVDGDGSLNVNVWSGDAGHNQPIDSEAWSSGANGTWYWQVRSVDAAGNKSAWATPWRLTIDMQAPTITVTGGDLTLEAGDAYTEQGATWIDNVDGSGDVDSGDISGSVNMLVPGINTISYSKTDTAGNPSTATRTVTVVDTTAPTVTINGLTTTDTTPTLTGTISNLPDVDSNAVVTITVNGTSYTATNNGDGTWSFTLPNPLADGTYTVSVVARDLSGNVTNPAATATLVVSTPAEPSAPTTTTVTPAPAVLGAFTISNSNTGDDSIAGEVLGDQTTEPVVVPVNTDNTDGNADVAGATDSKDNSVWTIFGLAWYWWLAILAALAALWWAITAYRRSHEDEI